MNGRERILTVAGGGIPDRVPVSLFIQEEFLAYYYPKKSSVNRVTDAVACARELGIDVMPRGREFEEPHFLRKSFPNWKLDKRDEVKDGLLFRTTEIETPKGVLRQVQVGPYNPVSGQGIHMGKREYFINDDRDLEIFLEYVPALDVETRGEMKAYGKHIREVMGDTGVASPWGWCSAFNMASEYRNIEQLLIDPYLDMGFYQAFMEKLTAMMTEYNAALADTELDCIGIQGNVANAGLMGVDFFEEHVMPYEKQIISAIKSNGTYTLYHNCGKAKAFQESYVKMGLDIWETVAEHPVGDSTLKQAKQSIGDRITLSGNLDQINFLKQASLEEVEEKVTEIMEIGKPGGKYLFAASDFLEKNTPLENVRKMIEVAKREGKY
ncbi:uroporphyrinogen decarboxylase family protein [Anaerotalea alkaliphila]|uniref:Uroporphyrinogen decarboxylase (URO-D) domain-containing protein n=1 Tax=Anaerotalea alkaliphila TaxID=2662126 RepID=A0A7X5HXP0_9FIRM|nr:uroporphyrinogen decarboxylase family protein [Anaerotalea alkaliphila]NDL68542.1 hypothetical protein [Anaerotalea alkaliphila]